MQQTNSITLCLMALVFAHPANSLESKMRGMARHSLGSGAERDMKSEKVQAIKLNGADATDLGVMETTSTTTTTAECTGWILVGCKARRPNTVFPSVTEANMTREVCLDFCKAGYAAATSFGLEGGDTCYCFPYEFEFSITSAPGCDIPCAGDSGQMCGGKDVSLMYKMDDCQSEIVRCMNGSGIPEVTGAEIYHSDPYEKHMSCANLQDVYGDNVNNKYCDVHCIPGFKLTRNDITCELQETEDGVEPYSVWKGDAECEPYDCGEPDCVAHATNEEGAVSFPNSVKYMCSLGYTTDGTPSGNTSFFRTCLATGELEEPEACMPIVCGEAPVDPNGVLTSPYLVYNFEREATYMCNEGYTVDGDAAGKTGYAKQCLGGGNFSNLWSCLPVSCGPTKTFANATLANKTGTDVTYPTELTYLCEEGFSVDVRPQTPTNNFFVTSCTANGKYSLWRSQCKRVSCGSPEPINYSSFESDEYLFYQDVIVYTCDVGYTTDGQPKGPENSNFSVECGSDGQFVQQPKKCLPVQCPNTPVVPNATLVTACAGDPCVYMEEPLYSCNAGFSTYPADDPRNRSNEKFSLECLANGLFEEPPTCYNIDNCQYPFLKSPGEQGTCYDNFIPTGKVDLDYSTVCESGYEVTKRSTMFEGAPMSDDHCTNINDCPPKASFAYKCGENQFSDAGVCVDELNMYSCNCSDGFEVVQLKNSTNQTCIPMGCGEVPTLPDSTFVHPPFDKLLKFMDATQTLLTPTDLMLFEPPVNYTCDTGFSLTGTANGSKTFTMGCVMQDGAVTMTDAQTCLPVTCGAPYNISNAEPEKVIPELIYSKAVENRTLWHACDEGFTNDTMHAYVPGAGFYEECYADGSKSPALSCVPVNCGAAPAITFANVTSTDPLHFGDEVEYVCLTGYSTDGSIEPAKAKGLITCDPDSDLAGITPCQPIKCGKLPPNLTDFHVAAIPEHGSKFFVYPEVAEYKTFVGYTLGGAPDGDTTFEVKCLPTGAASLAEQLNQILPTVKPVLCGAAPFVANSLYDTTAQVFMDEVVYSCDQGHSTDAEPATAANSGFTITCQANGSFTPVSECKPIICDIHPKPAHATKLSNESVFVFEDDIFFECNPGYSLSGLMNGTTHFAVSCLYNGTFAEPAECLNINNCMYSNCTDYGTCVDNAKPIGKHVDDHKCVCQPGFKEVVTETYRTCVNINDCPVGACEPGTCQDLILGYKCLCPTGYYNATNTEKTWPQDCFRQSCGSPPVQAHADVSDAEVLFEGTATYTCKTGYTLTGEAGDEASFTIGCMAGAVFTSVAHFSLHNNSCQPVLCGHPPLSENLDDEGVSKKDEVVFPEVVTYTCETGYTIDGTCSGAGNYSRTCAASGDFEYVGGVEKKCLPVLVGTPSLPNAIYKSTAMYYPETRAVTCDEGYSLEPKFPARKNFTLKTKPDCTWQKHDNCAKVSCGKPAVFPFTTVSVSTDMVYQEKALYTAAVGYSFNGAADGPKTCEVTCTATGMFSKCPAAQPVKCSMPSEIPSFAHIMMPKVSPLTYQMNITFICHPGYTTDAKPVRGKDNGAFEITCQADGTFSAPEQCVPVECGEPPKIPHAKFNKSVPKSRSPRKTKGKFPKYGKYSMRKKSSGSGSKSSPKYVLKFLQSAQSVDEAVEAVIKATEKMLYMCDPGYSLDGLLTGRKRFWIGCKFDGKFTEPITTCKNMDDCEGNRCSPNGFCTDNKIPTGNHSVDYTCNCDYGHYVKWVTPPKGGMPYQTCSNPDDCPPDACSTAGYCKDLLNDYSCICPLGYYEGMNGSVKDCLPKSCGVPPARPFASPATTAEQFFPQEVEYSCSSGYSLDGTADGDYTFTASCNVSADNKVAFVYDGNCQPIKCADPAPAANAQKDMDTLEFPQNVSYTCLKGFSYDGTCTGPTKFSMTCDAAGNIVDEDNSAAVPDCHPVSAGSCNATALPFAIFDDMEMFYGDSQNVTCMAGYSTNEANKALNVFAVTATPDCSLTIPSTCVPLKCGAAPVVKHTTMSNTAKDIVFPTTVSYTCVTGYTLDGAANGSKKFSTSCNVDGIFDSVVDYVPQRVSCGKAKKVDNAKPPTELIQRYTDVVKYSCKEGYSTDGEPVGAAGKKAAPTYYLGSKDQACPKPIETSEECQKAARELGGEWDGDRNWGDRCFGCMWTTGDIDVNFNTNRAGNCGHPHQQTVCIQAAGADADGNAGFEVTCLASGEFSPTEKCQPVKCAEIPAPAKSTKITPGASYVYKNVVQFMCLPGWSIDGKLGGQQNFTTKCQADGTFTETESCLNMNDCIKVPNENGVCVDHKEPTGVHLDDYHMNCDSGFEEILSNGVKVCSNIQNCTKTACLPGSCVDKVNDFECVCPLGWVGTGGHECVRKSCGTPAAIPNAKNTAPELFFMDTFEYVCKPGYTKSGVATKGLSKFTVTCEADGEVSGIQQCLPVSCNLLSFENAVLKTELPPPEVDPLPVQCTQKVVNTPNDYNYYLGDSLSGTSWSFEFEVKAKNDAHIFLGDHSIDNGYEIVIGGWGNTQSIIRTRKQGKSKNDRGFVRKVVVDRNKFVKFGVSREGNKLTVTRKGKKLMTLSNMDKIVTEYYVATGWGATGVWKLDTCKEDPVALVAYWDVGGCGPRGDDHNWAWCDKWKFQCKAQVPTSECSSGFATLESTQGTGRVNSANIGGCSYYYYALYRCAPAGTKAEAPPPPEPMDCFTRDKTYYMPEDMAGHGRSVEADAEGCRVRCARTVGCAYFSFWPDGGCHLQPGWARRKTTPGGTSGPATCPQAPCEDKLYWKDEKNYKCSGWKGYNCDEAVSKWSYSQAGKNALLQNCRKTCGLCQAAMLLQTEKAQAPKLMVNKGNGCCRYQGWRARGKGYKTIEECTNSCLQDDDCTGADVARPKGNKYDCYHFYGDTSEGFNLGCGQQPNEFCYLKEEAVVTPLPHNEDKTTFPNLVEYVCDGGHSTLGTCDATSQSKFQMKCTEDGSMQFIDEAHAKCAANSAGVLAKKDLPFSSFVPGGEIKYDNIISVTCWPGYSIVATDMTKNKFEVKSTPTCGFEPYPTCGPIICDTLPVVTNAVRSKETIKFGEVVTYTCNTGYTLDAKPLVKGTGSFSMNCDVDGSFESPQSCKPVECGVPENATNAVAASSKMLTFVDNTVKYTCVPGFSLDGKAGGRAEFTVTCQANGDQAGFQTCKPVECAVPDIRTNSVALVRITTSIVFMDKVKFNCNQGFSIDGKVPDYPNKTSYYETCLSTGVITDDTDCADIDYCVTGPGHCAGGPDSKCVDGLLGYTCNCSAGYEAKNAADGTGLVRLMCVEVNECIDPMYQGNKTCAPHGTCVDKFNSYICDCDEGYKAVDMRGLPNGRQRCEPVECGALPSVPYAARPAIKKLVYPKNVTYECDDGYSTDAEATGPTSFTVACQSNKKLTPVLACLPVKCPPKLPVVKNAKTTFTGQLAYSVGVANYTCDEGYTTTGQAEGSKLVAIQCDANGAFEFMTVQTCKKVTCGMAPDVEFSEYDDGEKFFGSTTTYKCDPGYSVDGDAKGPKEFTITCASSGNFTDVGACNPVSCGLPASYANAKLDIVEKVFKEKIEVSCDTGYSVTGVYGDDTKFLIKCGADGSYATVGKYSECLPISCGTPKPKAFSKPTSTAVVRFNESAEWKCIDIASVDGSQAGDKSFTLSCEANGKFSQASPIDCMDIDYCHPGPCGTHGTCFDCSTVGCGTAPPKTAKFKKVYTNPYSNSALTWRQPKLPPPPGMSIHTKAPPNTKKGAFSKKAPPKSSKSMKFGPPGFGFLELRGPKWKHNGDYGCLCQKGYETKLNKEGKLTCSEDDCTNSKCGDGGSCVDLSTLGGKENAYKCNCRRGYVENTTTDGFPTCTPVICKGPFNVKNAAVMKHTKRLTGSKRAGLDTAVIAWDLLTYSCAKGYSTDGSTSFSAKLFSTQCSQTGKLTHLRKCQKIKCDSLQVMPIATSVGVKMPDASELKPPGTSYSYGDTLTFECEYGFQVSKGVTDFSIQCMETSMFSKAKTCKPISCGKPQIKIKKQNVSPSITTAVTFGTHVNMACHYGHRTVFNAKQYVVHCKADGDFTTSYHCRKVKCANGLVYGQSLKKKCPAGYKTDAGKKYVVETCLADKTISKSGVCKQFAFKVSGIVTDAVSEQKFLPGAQLTFTKQAVSKSSCSALGWFPLGQKEFCASDQCQLFPKTHQEAKDYCTQLDARLCTGVEIASLDFGYCMDHSEVWTSTPCPGGYYTYKAPLAWQPPEVQEPSLHCVEAASATVGHAGRCCADITADTGGPVAPITTATGSSGKYSVNLVPGTYNVDGTFPQYIPVIMGLTVDKPIKHGPADIEMSPAMKDDQMRIIMRWADKSSDLDSWTTFGPHTYCEMDPAVGQGCSGPCDLGWWLDPRMQQCTSMMGEPITATLDRDQTEGWGPETTTISNIGKCAYDWTEQCMIVFSVWNYTPDSEKLKKSDALITVLRGTQQVDKFYISELMTNLPEGQLYLPVLTINSKTGEFFRGYANDKVWADWHEFLLSNYR